MPPVGPQGTMTPDKLQAASLAAPALVSRKASRPATIVCVGKGGAGKSSTGINLAVIALHAGFKTAILDADPQQSSFVWRSVRGRKDIPVCRCGPEALDDAIEAARRAEIEVLLIDMPPDLRHVPAVARHADLLLCHLI